MDLGIAGKVALVSGGSKGMGRATAEELGREGCRVVVTARGREAIDETVEAIRAAGGTAIGVPGDFTVRDEIERIVATARAELGPVEIAVFNVYGPTHGRYDEVTDDALQAAYNDMVMALHWMTQAVLPDMKTAKWGRLVTINSISSKEVHRELPLFTANLTRVAAVSFNKTLSAEVGQYGITVNTMGTGGFMTDRYSSYMRKRAEEQGVEYDEYAAMPSRSGGLATRRRCRPRSRSCARRGRASSPGSSSSSTAGTCAPCGEAGLGMCGDVAYLGGQVRRPRRWVRSHRIATNATTRKQAAATQRMTSPPDPPAIRGPVNASKTSGALNIGP